VWDHFAAEPTNALTSKWEVDTGVRPTAQIKRDVDQGFIERHAGVAKASNTSAFGKRFVERLAEGDPDVFRGVVLIDVQVAAGLERQIKTSVPRQAVEHVVEKADTSGYLCPARTVQVEQYFYAAFAGLAVDMRGPRLRHSSGGMVMVRVEAPPRPQSDVQTTRFSTRTLVAYLVVAALVLPLFAPEIWTGFRIALSDTYLSAIAISEQPLSVRAPGGQWAIGLALVWFCLAYWRRSATRWQAALVVLGGTAALLRTGNAWLDGLALIAPLGTQLAGLRLRWPLLAGTAAIGVLVAIFLAWTTRPPALPQAAVQAVQSAGGAENVFTDWRWAPRLQSQVNQNALASGGLGSESKEFWANYVHISLDYERWDDELRDMHVDVVAVPMDDDAGLVAQLRTSSDWHVVYDAGDVLVASRVAGQR
jgi:hypothetical protein